MGQTQTTVPETVDAVHMQVVRHAKVLAEINSLTYEDFQKCIQSLNALSRKCIDPNGKQLVFLVKRGSDTSIFWKATVKIASIKVDPTTRQIDSYKFLNLKQFLCVFKTFQSHLESLVSSEHQQVRALTHCISEIVSILSSALQQSSRRGSQSPLEDKTNQNLTASFMDQVTAAIVGSNSTHDLSESASASCAHGDHVDECCICLERSVEVILPCTHSFCAPCIEQWNVNNKTCPICSETLNSTDDTWVMSDLPGVEEINEKICAEFRDLSKNAQKFERSEN